MDGSYEGARAPRRRGRTALWALGILVVLGVTVGGTAAAGGFRTAPVRVPTAKVGVPVRDGRLTITTVAARYRLTDPLDTFSHQRGRYVAVLFHVTNVSQATANATEDMGPLHIAVTGRPAGTDLTADIPDFGVGRGHHGDLQPSITRPVLMVIELPKTAPVPRELALTIHRSEFRPGFTDEHKDWWATDDIAAVVTVPVKVTR